MTILTIVLQSVLALMFLMASSGKLSGAKVQVEGFNRWGLPQWFRVVTGLIELIGAGALIVGYWDASWIALGAIIIGITGIGGTITHIRANDTMKETFMIVLLDRNRNRIVCTARFRFIRFPWL